MDHLARQALQRCPNVAAIENRYLVALFRKGPVCQLSYLSPRLSSDVEESIFAIARFQRFGRVFQSHVLHDNRGPIVLRFHATGDHPQF